eukprot:3233860-Pyramimonas_sp.AAC.1
MPPITPFIILAPPLSCHPPCLLRPAPTTTTLQHPTGEGGGGGGGGGGKRRDEGRGAELLRTALPPPLSLIHI